MRGMFVCFFDFFSLFPFFFDGFSHLFFFPQPNPKNPTAKLIRQNYFRSAHGLDESILNCVAALGLWAVFWIRIFVQFQRSFQPTIFKYYDNRTIVIQYFGHDILQRTNTNKYSSIMRKALGSWKHLRIISGAAFQSSVLRPSLYLYSIQVFNIMSMHRMGAYILFVVFWDRYCCRVCCASYSSRWKRQTRELSPIMEFIGSYSAEAFFVCEVVLLHCSTAHKRECFFLSILHRWRECLSNEYLHWGRGHRFRAASVLQCDMRPFLGIVLEWTAGRVSVSVPIGHCRMGNAVIFSKFMRPLEGPNTCSWSESMPWKIGYVVDRAFYQWFSGLPHRRSNPVLPVCFPISVAIGHRNKWWTICGRLPHCVRRSSSSVST